MSAKEQIKDLVDRAIKELHENGFNESKFGKDFRISDGHLHLIISSKPVSVGIYVADQMVDGDDQYPVHCLEYFREYDGFIKQGYYDCMIKHLKDIITLEQLGAI